MSPSDYTAASLVERGESREFAETMAKIRTGGAVSVTDATRAQIARQNILQGEKAERQALRVLKEMGFNRASLGLHYGRRGIDVYGIRNTPRGRTLATMEVKSTRVPSKRGTEKEILSLLKTDRKGLQQGSRLWTEDRLGEAHRRGSPSAAYIRQGRAQAGKGRIRQTRHFVLFSNVATGEAKALSIISNKPGNRVAKLKLRYYKPAKK